MRNDLTGQKVGRLTVIKRAGTKGKNPLWLCQCDCGTKTEVLGFCLRNGNTKSCGKHPTDHAKTHEMSCSKAYVVWSHMVQRCTNEKDPVFKFYGGRGITLCQEWLSFDAFHGDMGSPPDGMELERKDNNLGYSKDNCRWATRMEQMNNTRANRHLTLGEETKTMAQWRRHLGVKRGVIEGRLRLGWSVERALTTPSHRWS